MGKKLAVLVAGGTGGHINSALALGERFQEMGQEVLYVTGQRTLDYQLLKDRKALHLASSPLKGRSVFKILHSLIKNIHALTQVLKVFLIKRPAFVLGAGGYVCGPTLLAAYFLKVPVFVLEQNSVMGLTNRLLLPFCRKIFVNFHKTVGIPSAFQNKVIVSGNPVRASIISKFIQGTESTRSQNELRVVVFGGSLGADSINWMIWEFVQENPGHALHIRHQIGPDGLKKSRPPQNLPVDIKYEMQEYFHEIEKEYSWSDLIICRSGASTISELRLVKKPVILIPYPFHQDRHQFLNAENLKEEASFPVFISSTEELQEKEFGKLKEILKKVADGNMNGKIDETSQVRPPKNEDPSDSVTIIINEIENHV